MNATLAEASGVRDCYLERHRDAEWWLPDDPDAPHTAYWARFDPHSVYFVGGFGDKHYIGAIPLHLYQQLPSSEIEQSLGERLMLQSPSY